MRSPKVLSKNIASVHRGHTPLRCARIANTRAPLILKKAFSELNAPSSNPNMDDDDAGDSDVHADVDDEDGDADGAADGHGHGDTDDGAGNDAGDVLVMMRLLFGDSNLAHC